MTDEFRGFPKIARLSRDCYVTEKIDGTNSQIYITADGRMLIGKRTSWITPDNDNFGFAKWAMDNQAELMKLGPGQHFGEWWGQGIQRKYGLKEKRFSLFNVRKWADDAVRPACCHVVPVLYKGPFHTECVQLAIDDLAKTGSRAAPGFMDPEGVVVYHTASGTVFKKTVKDDEAPKGAEQGKPGQP